MSQMKGAVKHVELLDYLRAIAILSVLFFHTFGSTFGDWNLPWNGWIRDFSVSSSFLYFMPFSFGQIGVPIFFVVSGFCIHLSFQQQGQKWISFFIRRFFRVYPAYFVAVIFFAILNTTHALPLFHNRGDWPEVLSHLFLIHNWFPQMFVGINGSFWTLAVEMQLYLIYPALIFLVTKFGWRRTMVALATCEFLIRSTSGVFETLGISNAAGKWISTELSNSPFGFWFSWSLGAFIADAFLKNQPLPFSKTSPWPWLTLGIVSYFIKPLFPFLFPLAALTTAIITSRRLSGSTGAVRVPAPLLSILRKIGWWSYSIYLLHQPMIILFCCLITWFVPHEYRSPQVGFLFLMIGWLPIILFSILWYNVLELSGIALGKRVIQQINSPRNASTFEPERSREVRLMGMIAFMSSAVALLLVIVGIYWVSVNWTHPNASENSNIAWSLATNPDPAKRDGALAVKFAETACEQTHYKNILMVGTLAAAYAEAGRFYDAIATAQKACELSAQSNDRKLYEENHELLDLYLKHQPYHMPKQ